MKLRTQYWLVTSATLTSLAFMVAAMFWLNGEIDHANQQRTRATDMARELSSLRLLTSEYVLNRPERASLQRLVVARRLDRLLADSRFNGPEQNAILARLRARHALAERLFSELVQSFANDAPGMPRTETQRRFESQLLNRLVIDQQDSYVDVLRLTELESEKIAASQSDAVQAMATGLALIALVSAWGAGLIHRNVLMPLVRLQRSVREVGAGNWEVEIAVRGNDEIGELSRSFNTMTRSLRTSFDQIERNNQSLKLLNQELEAFSYSVSHDLRGPLRGMDGFSLLLLEDYGDKLDAEGRDALERIRAASQRMGQLIDDLLALSQVTRSELHATSIDLSAMARDIATSIEQEEPGRGVSWQIEDGLTLQGDQGLIRIALKNLLHNAFKFTGKTEHPVVRVGARARDGRQEVFVSDNGVGFDMAYTERLFGAFQRLHHASEFAGTGIGLAIVQRVVHRHGGEVGADALPGRGATFFFNLGR